MAQQSSTSGSGMGQSNNQASNPTPESKPRHVDHIETKAEVQNTQRTSTPDLSSIIGSGITMVMRDRTNMRQLEVACDEWVNRLSLEQRKEYADSVKTQLVNAKGALESLYSRILQQLG